MADAKSRVWPGLAWHGMAWLNEFQETTHICRMEPLHALGDHPQDISDHDLGWDFQLEVDATFAPARGKFGVGFAVRDSSGKVCVAASIPVIEQVSVLATEFLALQHGIFSALIPGITEYELCQICCWLSMQ